MKRHCHVIPQASDKYPFMVAYFDGRGKWSGSSFYKDEESAKGCARRLNNRWRREYNVAAGQVEGRDPAQPVVDGGAS